MSYFNQVSINFADSASTDAFTRLRVSQPEGLFDNQFTYNLSPLNFEAITNGTGAAIAHDASNRIAYMSFTNTGTGGRAFLQSYEYIPYQPGRSQTAFVTFNMRGGTANAVKFVGLSDGTNGVEFQMNGTTPQFTLLSGSDNGNQVVTQDNWNLDKLNGAGPSGITFDSSKTHIFIADLQALYVGRVRVGFDINGLVYYVHQFTHANSALVPYIQSANLPVRCGMRSTGTVSTTMNFVCCSVMSEGGSPEARGLGFSVEGSVTAGNGTRTHILSIRPKTTFNSIINRIKFALDSVNMGVTGANSVFWELCLGQAITGTTTFTDVNTTYSGFEFNTAGTVSGNPGIVIASGYVGQATGSGSAFKNLTTKYPITLDAAGAIRAMGTLTVLVTGLGGTSACRCSLNWREIR